MATRSFIAKYDRNENEYTAIYCHWDGYPEGVGVTLRDHYNSTGQVDTLLTYGDISSLRDDTNETKAESYQVVQGDTNATAVTFKYFTQMVEHYRRINCEYGYVWNNGLWECHALEPQQIDLYAENLQTAS
jgi:hypothetical protein